jgi:hypothetical protein
MYDTFLMSLHVLTTYLKVVKKGDIGRFRRTSFFSQNCLCSSTDFVFIEIAAALIVSKEVGRIKFAPWAALE